MKIYRSKIVSALGRAAGNAPTALLKINYINKVGYFCDSCTRDLLHEELATKIGDT
jgi:hypothetical protein